MKEIQVLTRLIRSRHVCLSVKQRANAKLCLILGRTASGTMLKSVVTGHHALAEIFVLPEVKTVLSERSQDVRRIKKSLTGELNAFSLDAFITFCGTPESRMRYVFAKRHYLKRTFFQVLVCACMFR